MHAYYIVPGIVDGRVAHAQAWRRLTDRRSPEDSIVHWHKHMMPCNKDCTRYHTCVTTGLPGSHGITEPCPPREGDDG